MAEGFRYHRRVHFAETDLAGITHFSCFFRYMEEAEHALWRAAGLTIARAGDETGWPRVAAAFEFKAPLRFEDEFDVAVRIANVSRRTIQYAFTISRDATPIGHGTMTSVAVHYGPSDTITAIDVPADLVARLRAAAGESSIAS
jgi:4-hydroxybenzoyl-CoA thioesterase/acyl-CoA thioester hydrolase